MLLLTHAEVLQQLCCLALRLPAVHLGEGHLQLCGSRAVVLGHLLFGIECLALFHVLPQRLVTHEHGVHNAVGVILEVILLEYRETLARPHLHEALVGLQLAADGAQQC